MKNKQHEYILRAFVASSIPDSVRQYSPELIALDSILGGYCSQLIHRAKFIQLSSDQIISIKERNLFSDLINRSSGIEKDELVVYYRLAILVEAILVLYRQ